MTFRIRDSPADYRPAKAVSWHKGRRGQAYNLNLAGSDILAPDGRGSWHHCRERSTSPKTNRAFWDRKRETNMARDRRVTRQLRGRGWKVIRLWQQALNKPETKVEGLWLSA